MSGASSSAREQNSGKGGGKPAYGGAGGGRPADGGKGGGKLADGGAGAGDCRIQWAQQAQQVQTNLDLFGGQIPAGVLALSSHVVAQMQTINQLRGEVAAFKAKVQLLEQEKEALKDALVNMADLRQFVADSPVEPKRPEPKP